MVLNRNMNKLLTFTIITLLAASACAPKKIKPEENNGIPSAADADVNGMGDSDSGKAMGLQTVHFAYDLYTLDEASKDQLKANAQILKTNPSVKIQIEGHCDTHGGIQYNLALGEKRANAVKKFMIDLGVQDTRISIISFGKEKLLDTAQNETADAKNRRGTFVITAR